MAQSRLTEPRGTSTKIIDGGDTITLVLPADSGGAVSIQASFITWALSAIEFGVETYAMAAKVTPGSNAASRAAQGSWRRTLNRLIGVEPLGASAEALRECGKSLGDYFTGPVTKTVTRNNMLKFAGKCVPKLMEADLASMGVRGIAAGTLTAAVGAAVSVILTAVNLLVTSTREVWDAVASFGGRSDPLYDMRITVPATPPGGTAPAVSTGPGVLSWVQEDTTPDGWVFTRRVGTLQISSTTLIGNQTVQVTYREEEFAARYPQGFTAPSPCLYSLPPEAPGQQPSRFLYLVPAGPTADHPALMGYGAIYLLGAVEHTCETVAGEQVRVHSYSGPANFYYPGSNSTPSRGLQNAPIGLYWSAVAGCGCGLGLRSGRPYFGDAINLRHDHHETVNALFSGAGEVKTQPMRISTGALGRGCPDT